MKLTFEWGMGRLEWRHLDGIMKFDRTGAIWQCWGRRPWRYRGQVSALGLYQVESVPEVHEEGAAIETNSG